MAHDTKNRFATREGLDTAREEGSCPMRGAAEGLFEGHRGINVGEMERLLSVAGGGVLAVFGAARGGLLGLGLAALGGGMILRGATGHCEAYHALGIDTSDRAEHARGSELGRAPS